MTEHRYSTFSVEPPARSRVPGSRRGTTLIKENQTEALVPNELRMCEVLTLGYIERHFANSDWLPILRGEFDLPYMCQLRDFLRGEENCGHTIIPHADLVFEALRRTPLQDVRVVIMGQDPYPQPGKADGLAFSIQENYGQQHQRGNDSLKNIIREVNEDWAPEGSCRYPNRLPDDHVCLGPWADQGVLLLNTVLTFREERDRQPDQNHQPKNAHAKGCAGKAWKRFTTEIIKTINRRDTGHVVFMLWGEYAKKKIDHIGRTRHKLLCAQHPRKEAGIRGTNHFSCANEYLRRNNQRQIDWLQRSQSTPITPATRRNSQGSAS